VLSGPIYQRWRELGRERSRLGYPTSNQFPVPGGFRQNFQGGYAVLDSSSGTVTVTYT